jgi:diguanylate cyclase (GGDEF)-like protein
MRGTPRVLVIGPAALTGAVAQALPRCKSVAMEHLLGGVWTLGHTGFDGVIVALRAGPGVLRAVSSLRELAPQTRIIVTCPPAGEPDAHAALHAGADDYVLEPVSAEDLETALQLVPAPPRLAPPSPSASLPSVHELVLLGEVLQNLAAGPQATLDRLAQLLLSAFDAQSAAIQVDDLTATAGDAAPAVLQEPVRRQDTVVGSLGIAQRRHGTYAAADAARLGDYARLIEAIIAQARERAHWQDLAWRDDLSGLRNRRYLEATLDELLVRAVEERLRLTVVLFDIDDFKTYNDHYGHETGDALIREVAVLLTRCSRERDVVARFGGDEFAVILWDAEKPRVPGSQHPTEPMALADRFCRAIREHDFKCLGPDAPGPVTLSGGLACFPWDGKARPEILRAADEALLAAKREGKNRIVLAESGNSHLKAQPSPPPEPPPTPSGD